MFERASRLRGSRPPDAKRSLFPLLKVILRKLAIRESDLLSILITADQYPDHCPSFDFTGRFVRFCFLMCIAIACNGCASMGPVSPLRPLERSLVFHPSKYPQGNWEPTNLAYEDVWFAAEDGTQLHGWYIPHPQARAVALFTHGNAGHLADRADFLRMLSEQYHLSIMAFDYRGFGRSEGKPTEAGVLSDAQAASAWLSQRANVSPDKLLLIGRSLGGGVAVDLASKQGARGLVLISTFTSLPAVGRQHFPWLPTNLMMTQRFDSLTKIVKYQGPLLLTHGDADRVVPYELGKQLFGAAPGPKHFVPVPGGTHSMPLSEPFHRALADLILATDVGRVGTR